MSLIICVEFSSGANQEPSLAIIVGSIPSISQMFRRGKTGYGDGYGSGDKRGSTQYDQASRQRASMATHPRASMHTNPRASMLSNPRASMNKANHPLDNISLSSDEDLVALSKESKEETPPYAVQVRSTKMVDETIADP